MKKNQNIDENLKKGITKITINNTNLNKKEIQELKEKIIKPHLKNKNLLETITTEHNIKKIAHRFDYKLELYDKNNNTLATLTKAGITPEQAIKETNTKKEGDEIEESPGVRDYNEKDWHGNTQNTGTIHHKKLTITFRRG